MRNIRDHFKQTTLAVSLPCDADGFLDRQCTHADCGEVFKVLLESWNAKTKDAPVFCPFCGHSIPEEASLSKKQRELALSKVKEMATAQAYQDLQSIAKGFNRGMSRSSPIGISMSVTRSHPMAMPRRSFVEEMQQKITCEHCQCTFAAVGAAYFCPLCGRNSVLRTFTETLQQTTSRLNSLDSLASSKQLGTKDDAARFVQDCVEQGLVSVVGGFERFTEARFLELSAGVTPKRGSFQRLNDASALWLSIGRRDYEQIVGKPDMTFLRLMLQRRHLFAHKQGMVDQEYLDKSGDTGVTLGQRLRLKKEDLIRLCSVLSSIAQDLAH